MPRHAAWLALLLLSLSGAEASGYELEVSARTAGQAYTLRWFRLSERDRLLNRRRLTQTLGLEVWDLLEPDLDAGRPAAPPRAPFQLAFSAQLRVDHDFGEYTQGDTIYATGPGQSARAAATAAVPELRPGAFGLQLLWATLTARGIAGVLDADLGRQLVVDGMDWYAFDGLHVRARLPLHLYVEGQGGLLVRDSSPLGVETHEPDGTSVGQCQAFSAEAGVFVASPDCPQHTELAPTFGVAVGTRGLRRISARLSYRRSVSRTAAGVFPDTHDEAPAWGVLEEKVAADVRLALAGGGVVPWAAARWNLLLGLIDEAHAGVWLGLGTQAVTLEALYSYPSFDGDSIFNVFSAEPYWDARATWDVWPGRGPLRGSLRGFHRRFQNSQTATLTQPLGTSASSSGAGATVRWAPGPGTVRLDLFYEDGYGGLRAGGDLSGRWRLLRRLAVEGRASLVRMEEDALVDLQATTLGIQAGGVWTLAPGAAVHLLAEENANRFDRSQLRLLAVLDLAFQPEH